MTAFFWPPLRRSISSALVLILISLAGLLTACGGGSHSDDGDDRIEVVTTLPLFADFVRQVGGDRVEVTALIPTGSDPHTWEPGPSDVKKVADADVAFVNGLVLDGAAASVIEANIRQGGDLRPPQRLWRIADRIRFAPRVTSQSDNPHLWLDAQIADLYAKEVRDVLNGLDVASVRLFQENYERYASQLAELDNYVRDRLATIPAIHRKLITPHDAFPYFAAAYDFEVLEFVARSPGQEPSPEDIANLVRAIRDQDVPAVFGEPQVEEEGRILQQAADDAGVEFCTLYSDSLDDRVTSYIELMRFNADELARCLGGE